MKVVNVRINGMENPVGFDFETVCVSWKVRETAECKNRDSFDRRFFRASLDKRGKES